MLIVGGEILKIKNIIFDLDNTLYDFSSIWKQANEMTFNHYCYDKKVNYEQFFSTYKKINNKLVEDIHNGKIRVIDLRDQRLILTFREFGVELTHNDCEAYYKQQFKFISELIKPNDKEIGLIERLKENYNLAILTNGTSVEQREKIEKLGLTGLFKVYISEEMWMGKPRPQAFLNVIEDNDFKIEETIMVGDSLHHDIEPAEKLGLKTCLVNRRWHFDDEKKHYGGSKVDNLEEFVEKLYKGEFEK